jgi:hypothetical protein
LSAVTADLTARYDARRVYAADGSLSAADWIATRARLPRSQVMSEVRVARRLAVMPQVAVAWRAGDISEAHARLLGGLAAGVRTAVHWSAAEALLVGYARTLASTTSSGPRRIGGTWSIPTGPNKAGAQRRHDALMEMAVRAMTAPADGKRPRPLVTVMVMVDYPTLVAGCASSPPAPSWHRARSPSCWAMTAR